MRLGYLIVSESGEEKYVSLQRVNAISACAWYYSRYRLESAFVYATLKIGFSIGGSTVAAIMGTFF